MMNLIEKIKKQYRKSIVSESYKNRYFVSVMELKKLIPQLNKSHRHALVDVVVENDWYDPSDPTDPDCGNPESYLSYHLPAECAELKELMNKPSFLKIQHIRIWDKDNRNAAWDLFEKN